MWRGATKLDMGARRRRGRQPNPVALTAMNCERCGKDREPGYWHSSDRPKAAFLSPAEFAPLDARERPTDGYMVD